MKLSSTLNGGFAKFEIYNCSFRKPTTIAKHLMDFVEKRTGIYAYMFFDNWPYFWKSIEDKYGDYNHKEYWNEDYSKEDCYEVPEYLAWVVDITRDADGNLVYMYFGFDTEKTGYKVSEDFLLHPNQ